VTLQGNSSMAARGSVVMACGSTNDRGRSVLSKALALLDAFSANHPELSLTELARRAGLPISTTYRLASELVTWGGLERVAGGGFRIGMRLWEVATLAPLAASLRDIVRPFMQDLYGATGENVHLAVLDGREALYIERITGRRSTRVNLRAGGRLPLHATGVGKVLLAHMPMEFQEEVIAAGLKRYTPYTIVAPGHLVRTLAEIRRTGIGVAREEMSLGISSIASPLLDVDGQPVAAMSIVMRPTGFEADRLGPAVRTAALCAARRLRLSYRTPAQGPLPASTAAR
jgi:DNA-binding IclR family transcriptional regulator